MSSPSPTLQEAVTSAHPPKVDEFRGREMDERLVVNVSRFPHETIDGETVLIDSETGHVLLLTRSCLVPLEPLGRWRPPGGAG